MCHSHEHLGKIHKAYQFSYKVYPSYVLVDTMMSVYYYIRKKASLVGNEQTSASPSKIMTVLKIRACVKPTLYNTSKYFVYVCTRTPGIPYAASLLSKKAGKSLAVDGHRSARQQLAGSLSDEAKHTNQLGYVREGT